MNQPNATSKSPAPGRVVFSHGLDSSPSSRKIRVLTPVAESRGWACEAIDYSDLVDDPGGRIERLVERLQQLEEPALLVGSSLGGLVSVMAAERVPVQGLFLMAPALFLEDRHPGAALRERYRPRTDRISIVHGWNDDIIPWQNSVRFAKQHGADLHLFEADHRLEGVSGDLELLLDGFLRI